MSTNRQIVLAAAVVIAFFLQLSIMPQFKILGVQPDLILVVAIVVAILEGPEVGAVVGFAGGLMQDLASPQVMGVGALTKALAAFLAGVLKDFFMTYSILLPVLLVFFISMLELSLHQVALLVLGQEQIPPFKVGGLVLPAALYDVMMVFIVYPLLKMFKFPQKEEAIALARPRGRWRRRGG